MARPSEPGEPGFSFSGSIRYLLNVGRSLALRVGRGLGLVNALRERFPGASQQEAGQVAAWTGQAMHGAEMIMRTPGETVIDFTQAPAISLPGMWAGHEGESWQVTGLTTLTYEIGPPQNILHTVSGTEDITRDELDEMMGAAAKQLADDTDEERAAKKLEEVSVEYLMSVRRYDVPQPTYTF
jgi:hypothetical protein